MPVHDDDAPLSAPASIEIRDTTQPLNVGTFDLEAFINGVRPTRRTVTLHMRGDLIGVMDRLGSLIEATPDGPEVDELIEQFEDAKAQFLAGVAHWTVEKRSTEWVNAQREACAKAAGIKLDKDGTAPDAESGLHLLLDQIANQVVEVNGQPVEITANQLRKMYDANEGEVNKLVVAVENVNTKVAQSAKDVLSRDFSQRSSTGRSGQAS